MIDERQARLRTLLEEQRKRPPTNVPAPLRRLASRLTGGDAAGSQLLRGLAWKFRPFLFLSIIANVIAGLFEAGTMGILTAALDYVGGDGEIISSVPLASSWVDTVFNRFGQGGVFFALIILAVVMQIGRSWLDYTGQAGAAYLRTWSEGDLRRRLFNQFTTLSYADVSKHKVGDLASYMSEVNRVGGLVTMANTFLSHLMIVLAYVCVLLWLSWQMTVGAVVGLFLLSFSLQSIRKGIRGRSKQFMEAYVSINTRLVEFLGGMRLLHTFHRQEYAQDSIRGTIDQSVRTRRQAIMLSATVPAIVQSLTIIGVAIFLGIGYILFQRSGDVSLLPRLATFVFIVYRMLPRVTGINSMLARMGEDFPFATRLATHLRPDDKTYLQSGSVPFERLNTAIEFEDVGLRYPNTEKPAVTNLSLTIERGKMIALVGTSGSGKSSIISLLMRLYDPTHGRILVDGVSLHELKRKDWLGRIGFVDQDTFVLHDSVRENIRFGRLDATDAEIEAAAQIANAHDFIADMPDGYNTVVGDRGMRLSGGQRQRLAIARAVLREPDILVLDEATSALDSHAERLIQDAVENLRADRTVIVIAHRLSTIARADQIVVMHDGRVVEQGTHEELLALDGRYRPMWLLQSAVI